MGLAYLNGLQDDLGTVVLLLLVNYQLHFFEYGNFDKS